jgi:uncharacterized damage-inducible protein DinB
VTAPTPIPTLHVPRPDEATPADETTMLRGWLTHLRESAVYKLEGLDDEQLRWKPAPTANSLGGIVVHLGYAERWWLRAVFADEDMDLSWKQDGSAATFEVPHGWSKADVVAFYRAETAAADVVLDAASSLDQPAASPMRPTTLRWIVTHLVEEVARHIGHMDITRQLVDGRTGR